MNLKKEITEVRDSVDTSYILERSKFVNVEDQKMFLEKKWVWVPDAKASYIPGWIVQDKDDILEVDCDGEIREFRSSEVMKMNPPKFDMAEDLAALSHLNEPSVLYNLTKRYKQGYIYTYSGLFLLAINPYHDLSIYSPKYIKKYTMKKKNELEPHIFAVANEAYNSMLTNNENQSILITGESGAGKTENTKKVIEFLASVAGYKTEGISIDRKIIDSNPILEAFGNAKTVKNDNSSRFGKFIQIKFNGGNICGANIEKYLLEKSRITGQNQTKQERNYHIFYQLLKGADSSIKQALFLDGFVDSYRFLKNGCHEIEGVDDAERFRELRKCMRALDIDEETELFYYKIVATVLHLGNLEFELKNKQVEIVNIGTVDKICRLLSISSSDFIKCLIHPEIKAGHEVVSQHRTVDQVYRIVEALAKILYDKMFDSLIANLNRCLGTTVSSSFIGVLDIAGFEIFQENSFEQLCINYTNEKLQQYFNHHMFILEQEIYKQEAIDWNFIDFGLDLQPTIDLIESSNPIGIMAYLDEECVMPCASDKTFLEKLLRNIKSQKFKKINFKDGFNLRHYAGDVEYSVRDWIIKNKDPNFESITDLINKSEDAFVSGLSFAESKNLKKGFFRTVSQKHKDQLFSLMKTLSLTHPHFVRCIIPNLQKRGDIVENRLILEQLKCNGVLEGIRISRQGFPSRMKYSEFVDRYQLLLTNPSSSPSNVDTTSQILQNIKISQNQFRLGKTKIFFRQSVLAEIEDLRDNKISLIMREVQSIARRKMALRKWNIEELRNKSIICLKKNSKICIDLQNWNWWKLYLKIKPLLDVRRRDNEIKEKENTISKYSEILEKEKNKIKDLEKKIKTIQTENDFLQKQIESEKQYSHEKDELMKAIRFKNSELEENYKKISLDLKNSQIFLEKTMKKLNEDNSKFKKNLEIFEKEKNEKNEEIKNLNEEIKNFKEKIQNMNKEIHNSENENKNQFEKLLKIKEKEILNLKKIKKEFEEKEVCDLKKVTTLSENLNVVKKELENENNKSKNYEQEIENLKMTNKNLNSTLTLSIKKLKEENSDLQTENEKFEIENLKILRQNEEKENQINKIQKENDFISLNNANLQKTIFSLKDRLIEFEKREEEILKENNLKSESHENLREKIKNLEKKNKTLTEKSKFLENLNLKITKEKEEIHKENLNLLQNKLDDIFQREAEFNSIKNKLQIENQKLINENQRMSREIYEQKTQSESSDDSNSGTEKIINLLEQEKKLRREIEQKIIEKENLILILKNENEEISKRVYELEKESLENKNIKDQLDNINTQKVKETKELDLILKDLNNLIFGINEKYFKILEENRKNIKNLNEKLILKENLNVKINEENEVKDNEIIKINTSLSSLKNLNEINLKKINNLLNEFDSLKIENLSLETELEEKKSEIEKFKEEIDRLEKELWETQKGFKEEMDLIKEECEDFIKNLKNEKENLILNFKKKENKNKKNYEEKIEKLNEIQKKKLMNLQNENENLKRMINEIEEGISKVECGEGCGSKVEEGKCKGEGCEFGSKVECKGEGCNGEGFKADGPLNLNPLNQPLLAPRSPLFLNQNILTNNKQPPSSLIVYVTDKQKLKDLERKKLIYQKELDTNKELIKQLKGDLEKFEKDNNLLKNEKNNLKNQLFEFKKENNNLNLKLNQIERELKDEKELVGFLKGFSISRKVKK